MKVNCPGCGHPYNYFEACRNKELLAIIRMQPDFGLHAKLVFEYAELFGTTRPIKAPKLLRILTEVRELYTSERFAMNKRTYLITKVGIAESLKVVCNQVKGSLTHHNYLKKVMAGISEKEAEKRSIEVEKEQHRKEARLRNGIRKSDTGKERPSSIGDVVKNLPWIKNNDPESER